MVFLKDNNFKEKFLNAFNDILEVVLISVDNYPSAFQLFDSQNTRGKALDPHDLLKAYHLREMQNDPYEMYHDVNEWESSKPRDIANLFDSYLFPILNWAHKVKSHTFSSKDIDHYKGILESSKYTYARRAWKASPYFQITESFIAGDNFFKMVKHYLELLDDINKELNLNENFAKIKEIINNKSFNSTGFKCAINLFRCALLCYYDRFHNFDIKAVNKLFLWSLMLRVDMESLGYESINKYAIGESNGRYTNEIPIFYLITNSRLHNEISNLHIKTKRDKDLARVDKWNDLYLKLNEINGLEIEYEK